MFIWHKAYWIQETTGREYKRSSGSSESHLTANPLFFPLCHVVALELKRLPLRIKGDGSTSGGSIVLALRGTLHPLNTEGDKSVLSVRMLFNLQNSLWPLPLCRVHSGGGWWCGLLIQRLFFVSDWEDPWLNWEVALGPALATWCLSHIGWAHSWLQTTQRNPSML